MELTKENIQSLRQEYRAAELAEADVEANPILQFKKWFTEAIDSQLYEPNVMTLATADKSGKPSARIVLLKGFDEQGFVFFTNYESQKGKELSENPRASLVFFWPELERQVRIDGNVTLVSAKVSEEYFHSRPKGSQIGAVASPQSKPIEDRKILEERVSTLLEEFTDKEVPRPVHWGGYIVSPESVEFWQGRPSRLHDRISYTRNGDSWMINRLAP